MTAKYRTLHYFAVPLLHITAHHSTPLHCTEPKTMIMKQQGRSQDMWHVTRDTRHVARYTWHITGGGMWNFPQNVSSLALLLLFWRYFHKPSVSQLMNQRVTKVFVKQPRLNGYVKHIYNVYHTSWQPMWLWASISISTGSYYSAQSLVCRSILYSMTYIMLYC